MLQIKSIELNPKGRREKKIKTEPVVTLYYEKILEETNCGYSLSNRKQNECKTSIDKRLHLMQAISVTPGDKQKFENGASNGKFKR